MNGNPTDNQIRRLFDLDPAPSPGPGYWESIRANLDTVDTGEVRSLVSPVHPVLIDRDNREAEIESDSIFDVPARPIGGGGGRLWLLGAVASLVVVSIVGVAMLSRTETEPRVTAANRPVSTAQASVPGPRDDDTDGHGHSDIPEPSVPAVSSTRPDTGSVSTSTSDANDPTMVNQAEEDLRFDYGDVVGFETVDGQLWISFDRWSYGEKQLEGPELDSEPHGAFASDWHGGANKTSRLRTYPVADSATILAVDPVYYERVCTGKHNVDGHEWQEVDVETLTSLGAGDHESPLVSLTFDENHEVTLIRSQRGC